MPTTKTHPSTKTECDYLYDWIKKTVTYATISPKMVNPTDIAGNAGQEDEEEEEEEEEEDEEEEEEEEEENWLFGDQQSWCQPLDM